MILTRANIRVDLLNIMELIETVLLYVLCELKMPKL